MSDTTEALETELAQHIEGVMYADDIPEGTGYLPGTDTPIPDDYERRYCEVDGEDWPCLTRRAAAALAAARTENEDTWGRVYIERHNVRLEYERRLAAERERDEALAALANIAGMVEGWDWIPERGDVLSEVDRILSSALEQIEGNTDV